MVRRPEPPQSRKLPYREPLDPRRAGAGLGLPIARRLVEAQAGRIWMEAPARGHGSIAVLVLPAVAEVADAVNGTPTPSQQGEKHDDNNRTFARAGGR